MVLLLATSIVGGGLAINYFYDFGDTPATNSTDPVEIIGTAVANAPAADIWDLFFGGLLGVLLWIDRYLILPLMNFVASYATGAHVVFPEIYSHMVLALIMGFTAWWKWGEIWGFVANKLFVILIILGAVFAIGVTLRMLMIV